MSYQADTATDTGDLLDRLNTFLTVGHGLEPAYTGTGDGLLTLLIGGAASILETFTLTCTNAGTGTFSVVGSVTGALADATVGAAYAHAKVNFTIVAGGVAFALTDTITFVMTPPWVNKRNTAGQEMIWQAPGNDGVSAILVGLERFTDVSADYDDLRCGGFTGFNAGLAFAAQPGAMTRPVLPSLRVGGIPYWFIANGRRVVIALKIGAQYELAYLGHIAQYPDPAQLPYPLLVGGSMAWTSDPLLTSGNWRWSYVGTEHHAFAFGVGSSTSNDDASAGRLRKPDGEWQGFQNSDPAAGSTSSPFGFVWPYCFGMTDMRANLDASYTLLPIILQTNFPNNTWGELDGVMAVTGFGNAPENLITVNRTDWLVLQNITRAARKDYLAFRLA